MTRRWKEKSRIEKLFEMIDNASIEKCVFYYYDESECQRIKQFLSNLQFQNKLFFESTKEFWRSM